MGAGGKKTPRYATAPGEPFGQTSDGDALSACKLLTWLAVASHEIQRAIVMKSSIQNGRFRLGRAVFLLWLISSLSSRPSNSQVTAEGGELVSFFASEQVRGSVLTYRQSYTDDQNERVSYAGTLYAGINLFKLDDCQMSARVAVEDRYSGSVGRRGLGRVHFQPTGELTDDTFYEYRLNLADLSSDGVHDLRAVPAELNINTSFRCQEDPFCNLYWVQITATANKIAETRTVNGIQDINKKTTSIVLPMASHESAIQGTSLLTAAIGACSTSGSARE